VILETMLVNRHRSFISLSSKYPYFFIVITQNKCRLLKSIVLKSVPGAVYPKSMEVFMVFRQK